MSTPETPPAGTPPAAPQPMTQDDIRAIGEAAARDWLNAQEANASKADSRNAAADGAEREAAARGVELPRQVVEQMADLFSTMTVEKLQAAFDVGNPTTGPTTAPLTAAPATPGTPAAPGSTSPPAEPAPGKKPSWAQRFFGDM